MRLPYLFLAFLMLFVSCAQHANLPEDNSSNENLPTVLSHAEVMQFKEDYAKLLNYGESNFSEVTSLQDIIDQMKVYSVREGQNYDNFDALQSTLEKYQNVKDFSGFLKLALVEGDVLEAEAVILRELDNKMQDVVSYEDYVSNIDWLDSRLMSSNLDEASLSKLQIYAQLLRVDADVTLEKYGQKGPCWDCVWKKKWKILGWGALVALLPAISCFFLGHPAAIIICVVVTLGTGVLTGVHKYCRHVCF